MRHSVSIINGTYSQYELTSLLAPEDCASRSLVKNEIQGEGEEGHPEDISGEQLLEDDNEETLKNDNTLSSQDNSRPCGRTEALRIPSGTYHFYDKT